MNIQNFGFSLINIIYLLTMQYLCVLMVMNLFCREVTSDKIKEVFTLEIETVEFGPGKNFAFSGSSLRIICKGSSRSQKLEWYDAEGNPVSHQLTDRVKVQENISTLYQKTQGLVLTIDEAKVTDSGVWECRAGDLRETVSVCILDPVEFLDHNNYLEVDEGRAITLSCQVKGDPEPNIYWYRNGVPVTEEDKSNKYKIMTRYNIEGFEGLLTIKSLTPDDAGVYDCITNQEIPLVKNCIMSGIHNITLNVNHGPSFTSTTVEHYFVGENYSVDLVCSANGYPPPAYRWFQESGPLLKELTEKQINLTVTDNKSLLQLVVKPSVFGQKYKCRATNDYGEAYKEIVIHKLDVPLRPNEMGIYNYTDTTIQFNATWDDVLFAATKIQIQYLKKDTGSTPGEYRWQKANEVDQDIVGDLNLNETIITLEDLQPGTEYWVRVRLSNNVGQSPWTLPLLASTSQSDEIIVPQPLIPGDPFFYGVILTVVIVVAGVACMMLIKTM